MTDHADNGHHDRPPREAGFSKDADKLIRRLSLVAFLLSRHARPVSAAEIRRRVEGYALMTDDAFKRRFYEDRAELAELGIVIAHDVDEETGDVYSLPAAAYYLPPVNLSRDELSALAACLAVLGDRFAYAQPLRLALLGLAQGRPESVADEGDVPAVVLPQAEAERAARLLPKLQGAVAARKTVVFTYYAIERDEERERTVDPYSLMLVGDEWYLIGHCHLRGAIRTFRLSRIRSRVRHATRAAHDFEPPSRFTLADYVDRPPWQLGPAGAEAIIWVSAAMAWWVEAHFGHCGTVEPVEGGALRYTTRYASPQQLAAWVLGLGAEALVEEPPELRALVCTRLRRLLARLDDPPAVEADVLAAARAGQPNPAPATATADRHEWSVDADHFVRLSRLSTYLLRHCGDEGEALLDAAEVCAALDITADELRSDVRLLNLVNFGGEGALIWAELKRDRLEVTCDLAGSAFAPPARLSPLEADTLLLAIELVGGQLPSRHGAALRGAAEKLRRARRAAPQALVTSDLLATEEGVFDAVNDAVRRRHLLRIDYYSEGRGTTTQRVVEPYLLLRSRGEWYYVSYCLHSQGTRVFRVSTTKSATVLDDTFVARPPMELDLYRREGLPAPSHYAVSSAVVWYSPAVRRWAEERQALQVLPDGSGVGHLPYLDLAWLVQQLLRFGGEALPLEPADAVAATRAAAQRIDELYGPTD